MMPLHRCASTKFVRFASPDPGRTLCWILRFYLINCATKSGEKWFLATGAMEVLPDISGTEFDGRSHARRVLDGLEALIEGRSTTDVTSLSVRGRSISRMDITELLRWRDKYRTFVRQEADAQAMADGRSPSTKILVRLK